VLGLAKADVGLSKQATVRTYILYTCSFFQKQTNEQTNTVVRRKGCWPAGVVSRSGQRPGRAGKTEQKPVSTVRTGASERASDRIECTHRSAVQRMQKTKLIEWSKARAASASRQKKKRASYPSRTQIKACVVYCMYVENNN
jgi:hypothetical protein